MLWGLDSGLGELGWVIEERVVESARAIFVLTGPAQVLRVLGSACEICTCAWAGRNPLPVVPAMAC